MTYFHQEIRRTNINFFLLCILITAIPVIAYYAFSNAFQLFMNDPIIIKNDLSSFIKISKNPSKVQQYGIPFSDLQETGIFTYFTSVAPEKNERVDVEPDRIFGNLYITQIENKYLAVYIGKKAINTVVKGRLEPIDSDYIRLLHEFSGHLNNENILDIMFTTTPIVQNDFYFDLITLVLIIIAVLFFWIRLFIRINKPLDHPNAKSLKFFGKSIECMAEINQEFAQCIGNHTFSRIVESDSWIAKKNLLRTQFIKK